MELSQLWQPHPPVRVIGLEMACGPILLAETEEAV